MASSDSISPAMEMRSEAVSRPEDLNESQVSFFLVEAPDALCGGGCMRDAGWDRRSERPALLLQEFHSQRGTFPEPEWRIANVQRHQRRDRFDRSVLPEHGNQRPNLRNMSRAERWHVD